MSEVPDRFELSDEGKVLVLDKEISDDARDDVERATWACPTHMLSVTQVCALGESPPPEAARSEILPGAAADDRGMSISVVG